MAIVIEEAFQVPLAHDYGIYAYSDKVTSFENVGHRPGRLPLITVTE